jgi:hypothetical protein
MAVGSYWRSAREPRYSLTFALPLFALYEGLAAFSSHSAVAGVRNGADVLLKTMFLALGGRNGLLVFGVMALATVQGAAVPMQRLPLNTQLIVSLGAGVYEELVFRVLLVSAITAGAVTLRAPRAVASGIAIVLSALIFSGFHYVGPYGDPLTLPSFTFRAVAGLLFSGLYVARGFGITAWTHALYDVGFSLLAA